MFSFVGRTDFRPEIAEVRNFQGPYDKRTNFTIKNKIQKWAYGFD